MGKEAVCADLVLLVEPLGHCCRPRRQCAAAPCANKLAVMRVRWAGHLRQHCLSLLGASTTFTTSFPSLHAKACSSPNPAAVVAASPGGLHHFHLRPATGAVSASVPRAHLHCRRPGRRGWAAALPGSIPAAPAMQSMSAPREHQSNPSITLMNPVSEIIAGQGAGEQRLRRADSGQPGRHCSCPLLFTRRTPHGTCFCIRTGRGAGEPRLCRFAAAAAADPGCIVFVCSARVFQFVSQLRNSFCIHVGQGAGEPRVRRVAAAAAADPGDQPEAVAGVALRRPRPLRRGARPQGGTSRGGALAYWIFDQTRKAASNMFS